MFLIACLFIQRFMGIIKHCCSAFEVLQEQTEVTWKSSISLPAEERGVQRCWHSLCPHLLPSSWASMESILHWAGTSEQGHTGLSSYFITFDFSSAFFPSKAGPHCVLTRLLHPTLLSTGLGMGHSEKLSLSLEEHFF